MAKKKAKDLPKKKRRQVVTVEEELSPEERKARQDEARRRNLGPFIRERLSDVGRAKAVTAKFPPELVAAIDAQRGEASRSTYIREAVEIRLGFKEE